MGDIIIFWTNVSKSHEFDKGKAVKEAKEDDEIKNEIKEFIEHTIKKIKATNPCFESIAGILKLDAAKEKTSAKQNRSHGLQHYEEIIKENKEALRAFESFLAQI